MRAGHNIGGGEMHFFTVISVSSWNWLISDRSFSSSWTVRRRISSAGVTTGSEDRVTGGGNCGMGFLCETVGDFHPLVF